MTILESQGGESKKKSLALKASNSHVEESDEEEEDQDFQLLIKKFTKFAKRENLIPKKQNKPSKCFKCGNWTHQIKLSKITKGREVQEAQEETKGVHVMGKRRCFSLLTPMMTNSKTYA
ncbi:hypothetical protein PIB30_106096 [Stylosanthes scabra]|uniref:BED-type domain-containing protein n=1 Tax=Stylosanthes scabra TaxID=79078 RepID=A0ABU6XYA0_9FABA|nr:hypothetical protein [Stylosanthes scabra]